MSYSPRGCKESGMTERLIFCITSREYLELYELNKCVLTIDYFKNLIKAKDSLPRVQAYRHIYDCICGEGNGNPLRSCLENPMDGGAW